MSYARTFENGSLPPIHLSIITLHPVLITRVPRRGAPKGPLLQIGRHLDPCYGSTENVHVSSPSESYSSLITHRMIAGSGKSILRCVAIPLRRVPIELTGLTSSVLIRDIESISNAGSPFLAYFYFDFKDATKQDSRALLSSLIVQLSDQSDIFCDILFSMYSAHKEGSRQPTDDSLSQCLTDMLAATGQVPIYLIIDALDECPNDSGIPSSREKVLKLVKQLVGLHYLNLRLCVTSRPEFDIRAALKPLATQQISLHDEGGQQQDINNYITSVVRSDERMKRWRDNDKIMVIEKLTAKADGM